MYTTTRKITMVCLAVVFSVLVYGCGGGDSKQASTEPPPTDSPDGTDGMVMTNPVVTDTLTDGLTIMPGTYSIQPGETADAGDATFTCLAGGSSCEVTVADDGTTVTSTGGMATAMDSASATARLAVMAAEDARDAALAAAMAAEEARDAALEELRLANLRLNPNPVDLTELVANFMSVPAGTYNIAAGDNMDIGDANLTCLVEDCEIIVDEDSTVVSAGGVATAQNSMAAKTTIMAIALAADMGALDAQQTTIGPMNTPIIDLAPAPPGDQRVERGPDGVVEITLTHVNPVPVTEVEYTPEAVDSGHGIAGWMGQTLKRDDGKAATEDEKAVPVTEMDEATVYTNIDSAKAGKLKYGGDDGAFPANSVMRIGVDEEMISNDDGDTFTGEFIRPTDGSRIPGTFTCDADPSCTALETARNDVGQLLIVTPPVATEWTFESEHNVKEGETPDADYMYFGYWLKSPVEAIDMADEYQFVTFAGGNDAFVVPQLLFDLGDGDGLEATYEGGAAGRYVTRNLTITAGAVDVNSPGSHGRFTAKAELTANFGAHDALMEDGEEVVVTNRIGGTITEFKDGDTDLGFEVTLGRTPITSGLSSFTSSTVTATFGSDHNDTNVTTGAWSGNFYGANAEDAEDDDSTLPSGVAGRFNVATESERTRVVGAFAAEEK